MSRLNNLYLFLNDEKGRTLPRAKLFFYENNSFDFKNTYADKALTSVNPNPVIADGAGRFPNIFLEADTYRVVLQDEDGVEISTKDDVDNLLSDGDDVSNTTVTTSTSSQTVAGALDDRVVRVGSVAGLKALDITGFTGDEGAAITSGDMSGSFHWDAASTETPDDAKIVLPNSLTVSDPGRWVRPNLNAVNGKDYATLGSNIAGAISITAHAPGTVATASAACPTEANKYYQVKVVITTTASGFVKVFFDGTDAIYGDQPNGIYFSTAAILENATENNRLVNSTDYYYMLATSGTAFSTVDIETDTSWGGTISTVEVREVSPKEFGLAITATDGINKNNPMGIKGGAFNRGDIAVGDKFTLGAFEYDGLSPTPAFNVALGSRALGATFKGDQNTALGSFALQSNEGSNNTAVGYSALKLNTKGQENTSVGYKSGITLTTGYRNVFMGFWAGSGINTGVGNIEIGWRPNTEPGNRNSVTSIGYRAGLLQLDGSSENVTIGSDANRNGTQRLLSGIVSVGSGSYTYQTYGTAVGFQAIAGVAGGAAEGNSAYGRGAKATAPTVSASSFGELAEASGDRALALAQSSKAIGDQTVAAGGIAEANGDFTTSVGAQAGRNNTGTGNTFIGRAAGNNAVNAFSNVTCLGQLTAVTASNQVQLGDSATTTYAYGAVQDRSDGRDKVDVKPLTDAQIAFFMDVEWRQFRMDYREDYGWSEKDGSKARTRYHIGAVAQQVEEAMNRHGVDFAGLQHHALSGGKDVYTIGYQEFIGIQGEIIQRQQRQINSIEARLSAAGI